MSQFHVDQIATHVTEEYGAEYRREDLDDVNNLSRYLGRYGVDLALENGPGAPQRLIEVTDGSLDRGIDAIAVDPVAKLLVLVQSKWRQDGTGSLGVAEAVRFIEGVRSLVGMKNEAEPVHASDDLRAAIRDLLVTPSARIRLVTITTGSQPLAPEVLQPIEDFLASMNDLEGVEPVALHDHLGQAEVFNTLAEEPRRSIDLDVSLLDWGGTAEPLRIYYGRVSGADIAHWHHEHGVDLFAENIRVVIPRSDINAGIVQTVRKVPEKFGYYNNGITILADKIATAPSGLLNREVGHLRLEGASIVNGAQTVSTVGSVLGTEHEEKLGQMFVLVRCIEVPPDDENLARSITRYANTQNEVSSQDFAFLDDEQHRLARELSTLGFEYVIRQSEQPQSEDLSKVIHLREAAVALACAADLGLAVTAKREVSRLFAHGGGEYARLFNPATDPLLLSRSVTILRELEQHLEALATSSTGVRSGVAVHGRLVIAHVLLNHVGTATLRDPSWDLDSYLPSLRERVEKELEALVAAFPENSYPGNVFKNRARCDALVAAAHKDT